MEANGQIRRSESIGKLAAALSQAQAEIQPATKDKTNPHFRARYADLASVWDACRQALTKHGLAVLQPVSADGNRVTVTTILTHESGEWIGEPLTLTAANPTPQGVGSAITYGRRYGLASMVGIAPDDDDDGEAASQHNPVTGEVTTPIVPRPRPPLSPPEQAAVAAGKGDTLLISEAQDKRLWAISKAKRWTSEEVRDLIESQWGYTDTRQIPRRQYDEICKTLEGRM